MVVATVKATIALPVSRLDAEHTGPFHHGLFMGLPFILGGCASVRGGCNLAYSDAVDAAAHQVFQRCAAGESMSVRRCQQVIEAQQSAARAGAVLYVALGMLSDHARHQKQAETA
jgi:hypothetical protein